MARSGRFGRLPRSAPDLTSTIVALMREFLAMQDSNVLDAWKNGGEVDGKAVTDTTLLEHFRKRRDALSKKDPLWAQWDNRVTQYEFAIEDSKMQVLYDNEKVTDTQMANFYKRWADKTPNSTEFDRELLSAVGKFRAAAAARARAGAATAARDSFVSTAESYRKRTQPSMDVLQALVTYAAQTGIAPGAESLVQVEAVTGGIDRLLDLIQDGVDLQGAGIGNEMQLKALNDVLVKAIPGFNWEQGRALIGQTLEQGAAAATKGSEYVKNNKYGTKEWQAVFDNTLGVIEQSATRLNGLDAAGQLNANAAQLQRDLIAARDIPFAEDAAYQKYFAANDNVAQMLQQGQVGDQPDWMLTGIINEKTNYLNALSGKTVVPLETWNSRTQTALTAQYDSIKMMGVGMEMLRDGGWLQIVPDPNDPSLMTYEIRPGTALKGSGQMLVPGSNVVDPTTGAVIPIYAVAQPVPFFTVGPGGADVAAPAYALDPVTGLPIPDLDAQGAPIPGKFKELGPASGLRVFRLIDGEGKPYNVYQQEKPDGGWGPMLLSPPIVPGTNWREVQLPGGSIALEFTIDATAQFMDMARAQATQEIDARRTGSVISTSGQRVTQDTRDFAARWGQPVPDETSRSGSGGLSPDARDERTADIDRRTRELAEAGAAGAIQAGTPLWDLTKAIDMTTFQTNRPDTYNTVLAISLAREFDMIDMSDAADRAKVPALIERVAQGQNTLLGMLQYFTKTGDQQGIAQVNRDLAAWARDRINLDTAVAQVSAGMKPGTRLLDLNDPEVRAAFAGNPLMLLGKLGLNGAPVAASRVLLASRMERMEREGAFGDSPLGASMFNGEKGIPAPAKAGATSGAQVGDPREMKLPTLPNAPWTKALTDFAAQAGVPALGPSGGPSSFAAAAQRTAAPMPTTVATPAGIAVPKTPTPTPTPVAPAPPPAVPNPVPVEQAPVPGSPYSGSTKVDLLGRLI